MYNADLDHLYPKDPKIACTLNHLYPWITCTLGVYNSIWLYTYLVYISFTRRDNPHASRAPSFYWSPPFPRNVVQADQIRQAPEQRSLSLQLHRIILRDRANAKARLAGKSGRHFHKFGVYGHEGEMTTWNHTWLEKSCKFDGFGCCFPNWGYKLLYMILCVYIYILLYVYCYIYIYMVSTPTKTYQSHLLIYFFGHFGVTDSLTFHHHLRVTLAEDCNLHG